MLFNIYARLTYFLSDFSFYLVSVSASFVIFIILAFKITKANISIFKKKFFISIIFTILILIFTFSAAEAYFRYVYDESDGLGFLKVNARWHQRHVVTNNYFFRDRNFETEKKEGVTRIGVLGDSLTFGEGIKDVNNRFSNLLEKKLKDSGYNVEVYNLGKSGYDTQGEIEVYEKIKNLNFDIIVWQYYPNDIQPEGKSTGTPIIDKNSQKGKFVEFLSDKSFFFDFIYWRFSSKYQTTFQELKNADLKQYQNEELFKSHKEDIKNFIESQKKDGKKVIVIIFPFIHLLGNNYPAQNIHDNLDTFLKENDVNYIDLLKDLKGKNAKDLIASKFDSHPNEIVHEIAAQRLFEKIKPLLK